ncbi:MAG: NAD(P)/FAD-dependent oxidoreductase [Epsilonproteobacteria bacterium]|nr:NAD(P)/FAD-dependent oxidoreductase [Campylobacterota bacterium]
MNREDHCDVIVIGAGAAGIVAAITAARENKSVLLLEKLSNIGAKLKATGGGRCNLTNTLSQNDFMAKFGKNGRFMQDALSAFSATDLRAFLDSIGVATHAPDGFRIFPTSHSSATILSAFENEIVRLNIDLRTKSSVHSLLVENGNIKGVACEDKHYFAPKVILATGGLGYPALGAQGDGYKMACEIGHSVSELAPAMMPLHTKESWVAACTADTIAKATLKVHMPKYKNLTAQGDLIFTKKGIRGPVVLDFAREITPILAKCDEVPILANLTKGLSEDEIIRHFKNEIAKDPRKSVLEHLQTLIPQSVACEFVKLLGIDSHATFAKVEGKSRDALYKLLAWTPLTISGHEGFAMAMITRGGIRLKEIDPKTMQSRLIEGLYFCGEVVDIDGPCGGYNLQWSFSSGYLAAISAARQEITI